MADAEDLKSFSGNRVWVRLPYPALTMDTRVANLIFNRKLRQGLLCKWYGPRRMHPIDFAAFEAMLPKLKDLFDRDDAFFKKIRKK